MTVAEFFRRVAQMPPDVRARVRALWTRGHVMAAVKLAGAA